MPCASRADRLCLNTTPLALRPAPRQETLLADAGYPNGFDLELTAFSSAAQLAEAIAGEFHKIGVRAKVNP